MLKVARTMVMFTKVNYVSTLFGLMVFVENLENASPNFNETYMILRSSFEERNLGPVHTCTIPGQVTDPGSTWP